MEERWTEIGRAVRRQRLTEGYKSARSLADKAKLNVNTVLTLERGQPVSYATIVAIENAMGWLPGSIERVLNGGNPSQLSREGAREIQPVHLRGGLVVYLPRLGHTDAELEVIAERVAEVTGLAAVSGGES